MRPETDDAGYAQLRSDSSARLFSRTVDARAASAVPEIEVKLAGAVGRVRPAWTTRPN